MSARFFRFEELPVELQEIILSFLDYPSLITTLTVSNYIHQLAKEQQLLRDPKVRIQFLLSMEDRSENTNPPGSLTFPNDTWRWPNRSPKKSYICFFCKKLKPLRKFAHGQCFRMMIKDDYSQERKRFCLECGVKDLDLQDAGLTMPGRRKYYPGAMINSVDYGFKVHLCGSCGEWSPDFFCMKDKMCFSCTEKYLEEPEKFVEGYQETYCGSSDAIDHTADDALLVKCGIWEELLARWKIEEETWPRRPPCCRKCGGRWRFHPDAFGEQYGVEKKRPYIWRHGYKISGRALQEFTDQDGLFAESYMAWYCPFPNQSWKARLIYNLYGEIMTSLGDGDQFPAVNEVLD